ncbi:MAG: AAA family ATPase [Treponema sp.]|jgi:exonuclease SbcC|nr:AAA family ATPase [Treponema sp.]
MRILHIRFKNLNSLVGEWEIDLTQSAFVSNGIFAITGPTGAGKTTILDAVCLALYGSTPRLGKITKGANELMSRRSGECFAEVTFETQKGRFRCQWSQRRAGKKPEGELQSPSHEIADADSGTLLETKMRSVPRKIEEVTGMDFDRFTRSMLLAQGGFAAFLQAVPDERAPILEQITGTEIYSRISIHVHERHKEENDKLKLLHAELAGISLLTPADEQRLGASLAEKTAQDAELLKRIEAHNQAILWLEGMVRLEGELERLAKQREAWQRKLDAFAPHQEQLEKATQALECDREYGELTTLRREQATERTALGECREALPQGEAALRQAEETGKALAEQREAKRVARETALPRIRQVQELDLRIAEKEGPLKRAGASIAEHAAALDSLRIKQQRDLADLETWRRTLEDLTRRLEATQADEGLVEHLAGIRERFETLRKLHDQALGKGAEIDQAQGQLQEYTLIWQKHLEKQDADKQSLEGMHAALGEKQQALGEILEHREPADWRQSQSLGSTEKEILAQAVDARRRQQEDEQAITEIDRRQEALRTEASVLTERVGRETEKQTALEQEAELLEGQLSLLKKIEDMEAARCHLQDGEPCPLCGATEHPFAQGNVPVPDETRERLNAVRATLKSVRDAVSDGKVRLATLGKDADQADADRQEHTRNREDANRMLCDACSTLHLDADAPGLDGKLKALQEENALALAHVAGVLEAAEGAEKGLRILRESLEKVRESAAKSEQAAQAACTRKDSVEQRLEWLHREVETCREQLEQSLALLQHEVQPFGINTLSLENGNGVLEELASRRNRRLTDQKQQGDIQGKLAVLETQTRRQAEGIEDSEKELQKQTEQRDSLIQERDTLVQQRLDLFGEKKPGPEEARLTAELEAADQELEEARRKWNGIHQELGRLKSRIEELEKSTGPRGIRLQSLEEAFQGRLRESGFADESHYQAARLPEGERTHLAAQSRQLSEEKTGLDAAENEKAGLLETERQKRLTEEPLEDLKTAGALLVANQKELQQEIGGLRQKLQDNEELKQRQQERTAALEAQKRETSRWTLLHELIGSADGKKYRNFAQGLTFEMMIRHANQQLQKMSDRYLLIRDEKQSLELNVIDNYQTGEVRSTKNLSGGESFIVSLSLALGLSQMASKNVRVDSLFLDEGFGTLDEDALDTALETLGGLRQEGKLIGVISHVPALKERISAQIQVYPETGGRSRISGPGCQKVVPKARPLR